MQRVCNGLVGNVSDAHEIPEILSGSQRVPERSLVCLFLCPNRFKPDVLTRCDRMALPTGSSDLSV